MIDYWRLLCALVVTGVAGVWVGVYLLSHTPRQPFPEELEYLACNESGDVVRKPVDAVEDGDMHKDGILLSVVVPAYNETARIHAMFDDTIGYLQKEMAGKWEILIVDDGSKDGTADYCLKLAHEEYKLKPKEMRVIKFTENRGKGGAVRQGLLHIRGKYGLFADADGASKFSDVSKLINAIKKLEGDKHNPAIAIGSRSHMVNTEAVIKRSLLRNCLMYGFHTLVYIFGIRSIKDTQCGFKLFNRPAIDAIFPYMHTEGWIFDVEMLLLATRKGVPVEEIPISWHEVDGSKMALAVDSIKMAIDLVVIRMAYILGIYSQNKKC
ncbi:Dolichyl-phosphate beta-glucosyltransferase [Nakaseomyces bracarensis]|uniref:dolichyl-phosphate beta-glucosyltransferase n=1 Tax=Nakaseomyces bracarensis TaxID=273131 RepID=A0ABR4NM50_9SACH